MSDRPAVSVVLCTYQGAERVLGAVNSVLLQEFDDLELVVVDDGSTDRTGDVIRSVPDPRIVLITNPENVGVFVSRARALRACRGRYVAFIDDDDRWKPTKLGEQVAVLEARPDIALVHTRVIDVFPSGRQLIRPLHPGRISYAALLCQDHLATSSVIGRRSVLLQAGSFDESRRAFGDWDLWTRIAREHVIESLDRPLVEVHLRAGSIQRGSVTTFERERRRVLEDRWSELVRLGLTRRALAQHHYAVAAKRLLAGDGAGARRDAARSIMTRPNVQSVALLVLSVLPASVRIRGREALRSSRVVVREAGRYLGDRVKRRAT